MIGPTELITRLLCWIPFLFYSIKNQKIQNIILTKSIFFFLNLELDIETLMQSQMTNISNATCLALKFWTQWIHYYWQMHNSFFTLTKCKYLNGNRLGSKEIYLAFSSKDEVVDYIKQFKFDEDDPIFI